MRQTWSSSTLRLTSRPLRLAARLLAPTALLLLGACAAPKDSSQQPIAINKLGRIVIAETTSAGQVVVAADAGFNQRALALPASVLSGGSFGPALGSCIVATLVETSPTELTEEPTVVKLSGGSSITVMQEGQQIAKLNRGEGESYQLTAPTAALGTADLDVNVPGSANFPAFKGVSVPVSAPFNLISPTTGLTPTTPIRWDAGDGNAAVLLVGEDEVTGFSCLVPDTGSFEFSDGDKAQLAASGFRAGSLTTAGRVSLTSRTDSDALLMITAVRLTTYATGKSE